MIFLSYILINNKAMEKYKLLEKMTSEMKSFFTFWMDERVVEETVIYTIEEQVGRKS